jgi:transcriptional regulator with XRE-family HTH domain
MSPLIENKISSFTDRLKQAIEPHSLYRFSLLCGISQSNMSRYVKGKNLPGFDVLATIANVTGVSLDWLILGIGPKQRATNKDFPADESATRHTAAAVGELRKQVWKSLEGEQNITLEEVAAAVNSLGLKINIEISPLGTEISREGA